MGFFDNSNIAVILLTSTTTPTGNPGAGTFYVYMKSDGIWYKKNSAGTESIINGAAVLDINNLTEDASPDGGADYAITYDASAGATKKVLLDNLPGGGGGGGLYSSYNHESANQTLVADGTKLYTNGGGTGTYTFTLPASPTEGDRVWVGNVTGNNLIVDPNGEALGSSFYTLFTDRCDTSQTGIWEFVYINATEFTGWRLTNDPTGDWSDTDAGG